MDEYTKRQIPFHEKVRHVCFIKCPERERMVTQDEPGDEPGKVPEAQLLA